MHHVVYICMHSGSIPIQNLYRGLILAAKNSLLGLFLAAKICPPAWGKIGPSQCHFWQQCCCPVGSGPFLASKLLPEGPLLDYLA